jgi:hypothetical protein
MYTAVLVHETDPSACDPLESVDLVGINCVFDNARDRRVEASETYFLLSLSVTLMSHGPGMIVANEYRNPVSAQEREWEK